MAQGLDIGPKSIKEFQAALQGAKSIIWNGPMGVFEMKPFAAGTNAISQTLADLTSQVLKQRLSKPSPHKSRRHLSHPSLSGL